MARPPEVFVRPLADSEGQELSRISRRSRDPVRLRRAIIVLASGQGRPVSDIADLLQAAPDYVRGVIHDFSCHGMLDPKWSAGRQPAIDEHTAEQVCRIAETDPQNRGEPFTTWSLAKLRDHLVDHDILGQSVSLETLRKLLRRRKITFQATKTWKASNDPDYEAKKQQVLALYDDPPTDGRVICYDELGPLNLQPRPGSGWFPRGRTRRLRATYTRAQGVRQLLGALDLASGKIYWRIRRRKRWQEFLAFLTTLRARWPDQTLYIVLDNYSPHKRKEVRHWCADHDVELVFLPTYTSWLNWIESEFAAVRYFALNGADYVSHAEQNAAIGRYLRWRNAQATPKRHDAIDSPFAVLPTSPITLPRQLEAALALVVGFALTADGFLTWDNAFNTT